MSEGRVEQRGGERGARRNVGRVRNAAGGLAAACVLLLLTPSAAAQSREYELSETLEWEEVDAPPVGSDEWTVAEARRLIVDGRPGRAERLLTRWLDDNEGRREEIVADALLARGDARVAQGDEFDALYDYEELIRDYPQSDAFERAVERELEIGIAYIDGMRRKLDLLFGARILEADDIGVELLIRVQERLPGSALAERAAINLADYFYRKRQIELAGEAYGLYLENFPDGPSARRAARRQIYTDIARFKGPRYDASMLIDAKVRIRRFIERFPADAERRGINEGLVDRLDESLAAQLLEAGEWYMQVDQDASARLTLRRLIDRYPNTLSAQAAKRTLESRGWLDEDEQQPSPEQPRGADAGSGDADQQPAPADDAPTSPDAESSP